MKHTSVFILCTPITVVSEEMAAIPVCNSQPEKDLQKTSPLFSVPVYALFLTFYFDKSEERRNV
jgi:hypothetical protein